MDFVAILFYLSLCIKLHNAVVVSAQSHRRREKEI